MPSDMREEVEEEQDRQFPDLLLVLQPNLLHVLPQDQPLVLLIEAVPDHPIPIAVVPPIAVILIGPGQSMEDPIESLNPQKWRIRSAPSTIIKTAETESIMSIRAIEARTIG
jgi:hypothetical protein